MRKRHPVGTHLTLWVGLNVANARIHKPRKMCEFRVNELKSTLLPIGIGQFGQLIEKRPVLESAQHQNFVLVSEETFKPTAVSIDQVFAAPGHSGIDRHG